MDAETAETHAALGIFGQLDGVDVRNEVYCFVFKIAYEKEDPAIREEYYRELEKNGIQLRLKPLDQGRG